MTSITYTNPIDNTEHTTTLSDAVRTIPNFQHFAAAIKALEDMHTPMSSKWLSKLDRELWHGRRNTMSDLILDDYNSLSEQEIIQSAKRYAAYLYAHELLERRIAAEADNWSD